MLWFFFSPICLFVCLSVCLSHSWVLSKRLKIVKFIFSPSNFIILLWQNSDRVTITALSTGGIWTVCYLHWLQVTWELCEVTKAESCARDQAVGNSKSDCLLFVSFIVFSIIYWYIVYFFLHYSTSAVHEQPAVLVVVVPAFRYGNISRVVWLVRHSLLLIKMHLKFNNMYY